MYNNNQKSSPTTNSKDNKSETKVGDSERRGQVRDSDRLTRKRAVFMWIALSMREPRVDGNQLDLDGASQQGVMRWEREGGRCSDIIILFYFIYLLHVMEHNRHGLELVLFKV